jgi:GntR family transcriptional regulator/MocR family aminotransferase
MTSFWRDWLMGRSLRATGPLIRSGLMSKARTSSVLELHVELDHASPEPLHRQLERGLRGAVRDGRLAPSGPLPSSRALASQLGISRGIVVEAYEQLVAEGYLASRPGGATRVARSGAVNAPRRALPMPPTFLHDFRPGRPDVTEFPRAVWLRSIRRALADAPSERLSYLGGRGVPELDTALATYLNRVRGTAADPADVIVCTGFAQGLNITVRALRERGARVVAVEDPSDPEYRAAIRNAGLDWIGIPVDGAGLLVERLAASRADAVVVTAAHQYPTGGVLPPERRAALVAWATRRGGTIIEDDYDAEFRYDREPIGAIQGLAPDRVVYAGSASKILAPGLRLGWLVAPAALVEPIVAAKQATDMGSAALDQLAFADVLARGELDHHLRRMRPIYRRRRDALLDALARHLPQLDPVGASAGLHLLAWLPKDLDEAAVLDAAEQAGIGLAGVTAGRIAPGPGGLIFGYGGIADTAIDAGIRRLAEVIAAGRTASPVVR